MLASIIIDNYNYGRFLRETIDSALAQTYPRIEVIVVDDGSTDDSREIIASYGERVRAVLKANGGQASAFNAGFAASRGDVVFFLDSDDALFPLAVENAIALFNAPGVVKVHWPLRVVNEQGIDEGRLLPPGKLPEGDFRDVVLRGGPTSCGSSPTSGNAWSSEFLERVLPMPEDVTYYKTCADEFLYTLAPVFGRVRAIQSAQGTYRIHGRNIYSGRPFAEKLQIELAGHEQQCAALSSVLKKAGFDIDVAAWKRNSWFHRLQKSAEEINALVPEGEQFLLVDDSTWGAQEIFPGHRALPFLERNGQFWGAPENDAAAIAELERQRRAGVGFIAFAWSAFWWLDHYAEFRRRLDSEFKCALKNERLVIYDLRTPREPSAQVTSNRWPFPTAAAFQTSIELPLVSVIINNFNYARFLKEAIDSALGQTYTHLEVIVVDDGSTDESRDVIARFGDSIIPVLKDNGGQASAYNAGFGVSRGRIVCFVDADDTLLPAAMETACQMFKEPHTVKVQWPLAFVDKAGQLTGELSTKQAPPDGDLRDRVFHAGPIYDWFFTTGCAYSRPFLEQVLPMPEPPYRLGADEYLISLTPIYGQLRTARESLGTYRFHGRNNYFGKALEDGRLREYLARFEMSCSAMQRHLAKFGIVVSPELWKQRNFNSVWPRRVLAAKEDLLALIPAGSSYILVNDDEWGSGEPVPERRAIPFLERDGEYFGPPADDTQAIAEVERLRRTGANFIAFWWKSFWWLEHYVDFERYLRSNYACLLENERLILFGFCQSAAEKIKTTTI